MSDSTVQEFKATFDEKTGLYQIGDYPPGAYFSYLPAWSSVSALFNVDPMSVDFVTKLGLDYLTRQLMAVVPGVCDPSESLGFGRCDFVAWANRSATEMERMIADGEAASEAEARPVAERKMWNEWQASVGLPISTSTPA